MALIESLLSQSWTTGRVIKATLVVLLVFLAFVLLYRFHLVLFMLLIGIVLSRAIAPGLEWLQGRRLPRGVAVVLIYLLLLGVLAAFVWLVLPLVVEQMTTILPKFEEFYETISRRLVSSPNGLIRRLAARLPRELLATVPAGESPEGERGEALGTVMLALSFAGPVARGLFTVFAVLLLGFYWTQEGERAIRYVLLLWPLDQRENLRDLVEAILTSVGAYLRGQVLLAAMVAALSLVAFLAIGLPSAVGLALAAGLMEFVPIVGPPLGALPAVLIALSAGGSKVIWVILAVVTIQSLQNTLIVPRVMHRVVGVNPVVTLLAIAGFGTLLGLPGFLLAIPMAAIIQILLGRFLLEADVQPQPVPIGRDRLSILRLQAQELAQDVRKRVRVKEESAEEVEDQVEDALEAIALDLDGLLAQVAPAEGGA